MYENEIVKEFVRKRTFYRVISFYMVGITIIVAIITGIWDKIGVVYNGTTYVLVVVIWILGNVIFNQYIGTTLSTCPICHNLIKTMSPDISHPSWRIGNGPLPDRCPHCNTDFSRYKDSNS